jgi:hypothetical protein
MDNNNVRKTKRLYRISVVRTYAADDIYVWAKTEEEAKKVYDKLDFIETGSDAFNNLFKLQREEVFADEDNEEKEN